MLTWTLLVQTLLMAGGFALTELTPNLSASALPRLHKPAVAAWRTWRKLSHSSTRPGDPVRPPSVHSPRADDKVGILLKDFLQQTPAVVGLWVCTAYTACVGGIVSRWWVRFDQANLRVLFDHTS